MKWYEIAIDFVLAGGVACIFYGLMRLGEDYSNHTHEPLEPAKLEPKLYTIEEAIEQGWMNQDVGDSTRTGGAESSE